MTDEELKLILNTLRACEYHIPDDKHEIMFNTNKCENLIIKELQNREEHGDIVQSGGTLPS